MAKVSTTDALKYALTSAYSIYVLLHAKLDNLLGLAVFLANLRAADYLLYDGKVIHSVYRKLKLAAPALKLRIGFINALKLLPKLAIVAGLIVFVHPIRLLALEAPLQQVDQYVAIRARVGIELSAILALLLKYVILPLYALDYFVLENSVLDRIKARLSNLRVKIVSLFAAKKVVGKRRV